MISLGVQTLTASGSAVTASQFTIPAGATHVLIQGTDGKELMTLTVDAILKSGANPFPVGTNATVTATYLGPHATSDYPGSTTDKWPASDPPSSDSFIKNMMQSRTANDVGKTVSAPSPVTNQSPRL